EWRLAFLLRPLVLGLGTAEGVVGIGVVVDCLACGTARGYTDKGDWGGKDTVMDGNTVTNGNEEDVMRKQDAASSRMDAVTELDMGDVEQRDVEQQRNAEQRNAEERREAMGDRG
ncbi:MAG: hypothetical protein L6R38_009078, partial [Xanthoria sp. 2 TBL-2021]